MDIGEEVEVVEVRPEPLPDTPDEQPSYPDEVEVEREVETPELVPA